MSCADILACILKDLATIYSNFLLGLILVTHRLHASDLFLAPVKMLRARARSPRSITRTLWSPCEPTRAAKHEIDFVFFSSFPFCRLRALLRAVWWVYVCVCVHVLTCMHVCMCVCVIVCVCARVYRLHTLLWAAWWVYACAYICIDVYAFMHGFVCVWVYVLVFVCLCVCVCMCRLSALSREFFWGVHVYLTYMFTSMFK